MNGKVSMHEKGVVVLTSPRGDQLEISLPEDDATELYLLLVRAGIDWHIPVQMSNIGGAS